MDELIIVKNEGYAEYEELLLKRDNVRKEAGLYEKAYIAKFGDMIVAIFEKKIECIKKKKSISYIQAKINRGESIDTDALEKYIQEQTAEYNEKLLDMIRENEEAQSGKTLTEKTIKMIKRLYHKLAKLIHPDINPITNEDERLKNLWNMVVVSYNHNNLDELEEAEILINHVLEEMQLDIMEIEIPDIDKKIARVKEEIYQIMENNPYQYKYLLENPDAVSEREKELDEEYKNYCNYEKELDEILNRLTESGAKFVWKMN